MGAPRGGGQRADEVAGEDLGLGFLPSAVERDDDRLQEIHLARWRAGLAQSQWIKEVARLRGRLRQSKSTIT